ncbi:MAG: DUF1801 domain-containing protein [Ignavibacteria bacterium]|jgi:uncharacterized protein YdhG (YjbR/CyaY superfamily)|nr:DUF1801 domain-containing protein [Ignavibacteria bacterium]
MKNKFRSIDEYIASFPEETVLLLEQIRKTIKQAAPLAEETISYSMPAFRQNGILVYFAAFKNHIGFFPAPSGKEAFGKELSVYKGGKGTVQFPLDKPLPLNLISRIVRFRVKENSGKIKNRR